MAIITKRMGVSDPAGMLGFAVCLLALAVLAYSVMDAVHRWDGLSGDPMKSKAAPESKVSDKGQSSYDLEAIIDAHIFGIQQQQRVATPEKAPETKLKLHLRGVIAAQVAAKARAIVDIQSNGERVYAVGDDIGNTGAKLHEIHADELLLERNGQIEKLALKRPALKLDGMVVRGEGMVDDQRARLTGNWRLSKSVEDYHGLGYIHDMNTGKGRKWARFPVRVDKAGHYEISLAYPPHPNRSSNVPVTIRHREGTTKRIIDQTKPSAGRVVSVSLGQFFFDRGQGQYVEISNANTTGYVVVDAVQVSPVTEEREGE